MTSVNISETNNIIHVTEETGRTTVVTAPSEAVVVKTVRVGPQGPTGPAGPQGPPGVSGIMVDDSARVDKSLIYYDAASASYKVDAIITNFTLTDGGNF